MLAALFEGSWLRTGSWGVTALKGRSVWLIVRWGTGCARIVCVWIRGIRDGVSIRSRGRRLAVGIWLCLYIQTFEFNAFTAVENLPVRPVRPAAKEEPSKDEESCGKNDVQAGVQSFAASDRCNQNDVDIPK